MAELDELIGRRVALRHRVATADGRPLYTDALGELADAGPSAVLVHTRRGEVRVARDAVVAVREIPPPPPRRGSLTSVLRLENACADAWPPVVSRPLGQWRLRAAGGFTGRANSALAVGDAGVRTAEALARVVEFAAEHRLPARVQVPVGSPWQRAVLGEGWVRDDAHPAGAEVAVLVAALADLPSGPDPAVRVNLAAEPDQDWWRLSGDPPVTDAQRHVLTGPGLAHIGFGVARVDGGDGDRAVGAVRLVVLDEHLYVSRLAVAQEYRRRGLATALMAAAARWALARDASWCVLQVAEHNEPALALYRRLGFTVHHRYQYLRPPER